VPQGVRAFSCSGWEAFSNPKHEMHIVRLRETVRRLVRQAKDEGTDVRFGWRVRHPLVENSRVIGVVAESRRGSEKTFRGSVVVDATGNAAALARRLPESCGIDFTDRPEDRIIAESRLYDIDVEKAARAAERGEVAPEVISHVISNHGAFSTLSHTVSLRFKSLFLLAGIQEENYPPNPAQALDELKERFDFVGREIYRGGGPIRIRRAGLRLVCDGFAVIGEAAGMVIPMQASGVTSSLLAGHGLGSHLGKVLANGGKATTATLWSWAASYQQNRGAVLASYDVNRRFLQSLDPISEIEPLFKSGVVQGEDVYRCFEAKPFRVSLGTMPDRMRGILQNPGLALKAAPSMSKIPLVEFHWRRYPKVWDANAFASWKKTAEFLLP